MARINKISITLCALLFTTLTFTPVANASQQARHSAVQKTHLAKTTDRKKKTTSKNDKKKTTTQTKKTASSKTKTKPSRTAHATKSKASQTAANLVTEKCIPRKGHKAKCTKVTKIAEVHKVRVQNGDLVFFRTQGRGTADHVGVYVGNGKFIQSPRSGQDIQITSLSEDYWVRHYVGARRVMTPKTIR